jgi:hypothetical protein
VQLSLRDELMNGAQYPNGASCAEWVRRATVDAVAEQRGQASGTLHATLAGSEAGEIPVGGDCGRRTLAVSVHPCRRSASVSPDTETRWGIISLRLRPCLTKILGFPSSNLCTFLRCHHPESIDHQPASARMSMPCSIYHGPRLTDERLASMRHVEHFLMYAPW